MQFLSALLLALLIPVAAWAGDADRQKATDAATSWLALVDTGNYAQSWKTAGTFFRSRVTEAQWEAAAEAARGALGAVKARDVSGIDFSTTLPGAPDGRYAVITFDTKFANKAAAIETIAMAMDGGSWKAIGYHVR
jgi:hypothetical protein